MMVTSSGSLYSVGSMNGSTIPPVPPVRNQLPVSMYYAPQHVQMIPSSVRSGQPFVPYGEVGYNREFSQGSRGSWFSTESINGTRTMVSKCIAVSLRNLECYAQTIQQWMDWACYIL